MGKALPPIYSPQQGRRGSFPMSTRLISLDTHDVRKEIVKPTALDRLARRIVLSRLEKLQDGQIVSAKRRAHELW